MSEPFPAAIVISRFSLALNQNKALTESAFTRQRQVISLAGGTADRWEGLIEIARLHTLAEIRQMDAFLTRVGLYGQFTIGHCAYDGAVSGQTSGLVQGAGQSGTSLVIDGFAASTLILREGEYFQVRDEFKRVTADATSTAGGVITVSFQPALRVSPANNDPVILNTPKLLCEITSIPSHVIDAPRIGDYPPISFQEALISV